MIGSRPRGRVGPSEGRRIVAYATPGDPGCAECDEDESHVMAAVNDLWRSGTCCRLGRPGGMFGAVLDGPELSGNRLQLLKEAWSPGLSSGRPLESGHAGGDPVARGGGGSPGMGVGFNPGGASLTRSTAPCGDEPPAAGASSF